MALTDATLRALRDPRSVMEAEAARGLSEARALMHLMLACGLFFVASLPRAVRAAQASGGEVPLDGVIAAHAFGLLAVAPLLFYGLAALAHGLARLAGGRGGFLGARAALFWSLLPAAVLALALALVGVGAEAAGGAAGLAVARWLAPGALLWWFWVLAASLAVTEGFGNTGRVFLATCAGVGVLLVGIDLAVRS